MASIAWIPAKAGIQLQCNTQAVPDLFEQLQSIRSKQGKPASCMSSGYVRTNESSRELARGLSPLRRNGKTRPVRRNSRRCPGESALFSDQNSQLFTSIAMLAGLSCFGFVACLTEPGIVRRTIAKRRRHTLRALRVLLKSSQNFLEAPKSLTIRLSAASGEVCK